MPKLTGNQKMLLTTYGELFVNTGGNPLVEFIEREDINLSSNSIAAVLQSSCISQLALLEQLQELGEFAVPTTLTCVYCGMAYPEGTPPHGSQVLTDHIKVCPSHPLRKSEQIILRLRLALEGVVGFSTKEDLLETKLCLKMIPMPEEERVKLLHAIDVLLEFHNA